MFWEWFVGGLVCGVALWKLIHSIIEAQMIRQIEKKHLHWILTDRIHRTEEILTMRDGATLQGYIYTSDMTPKIAPTILFLHGLGGFAQDFNFEPMLSSLCLHGFLVFAYDFRASGNSLKPGAPPIMENLNPQFFEQIFKDPLDALDWVCRHPEVDQSRLAVIGASLGASMALTTLLHEPRLKMIVALCAPHDFATTIERNFMHGSFLNRFIFRIFARKIPDLPGFLDIARKGSPATFIDPARDYTGRIFLAHAKDDQILPFEYNFLPNVEKLRLPPEQTIVFERGTHEFKGQEAALASRMLYWLDHNLIK